MTTGVIRVTRFAAILVAGACLLTPRPAHADFQFKKGSFNKDSLPAPAVQVITGLGFRPKAVIFFWTRQLTADTFSAHVQAGYGFATGPASERAIAFASDDAFSGNPRGNTAQRQSQSRSIILLADGNGTLGSQAELLSFDVDGFSLLWTDNETRWDVIHYIALGGSDILDARADSFVMTAGTGSQFVPAGFRPDFLMVLSAHMAGMGVDAVHAASNDNALHSMAKQGRLNEGQWPSGWTPAAMSGPSQGRPSTLPIPIGAAVRVVYLGSQDGSVYAFDADTGGPLWSTPLWLPGTSVQAGPSGIFTAFGGNHDYILVGTRYSSGDNAFYALDRATGAPVAGWPFSGTGPADRIGIINNQATVDYQGHRVYFASFARGGGFGSNTVWCVDLDTGGVIWAKAYADVTTSLTLRGGRLYFGRWTGFDAEVIALNASDGGFAWMIGGMGDGVVKGFVMADPFLPTNDLYFATDTNVRKFQDGGALPAPQWTRPLASPSTPVLHPGEGRVYVGAGDGQLHVLKASDGGDDVAPITLGDGLAAVGSPTIDNGEMFVYVGSEAGVVYAVQIP